MNDSNLANLFCLLISTHSINHCKSGIQVSKSRELDTLKTDPSYRFMIEITENQLY